MRTSLMLIVLLAVPSLGVPSLAVAQTARADSMETCTAAFAKGKAVGRTCTSLGVTVRVDTVRDTLVDTVRVPVPVDTAPAPCTGPALVPTDDVGAKASAAPIGTVFCMAPGLYTKARNVTPKDGQRFLCPATVLAMQPACILDPSPDSVARAFGGTAKNVVIEGLWIRGYKPPKQQAMLQGDNTTGWSVTRTRFSRSRQMGARLGNTMLFRANVVDSSASVGLGSYKTCDGALVDGNQFIGNPPKYVAEDAVTSEAAQVKLFGCSGLVVRGNVGQDGGNKCLWLDTDNIDPVLEGNTCLRHGQACIWLEAGYGGKVLNNAVDGCGLAVPRNWLTNAGIQVTNTKGVEIAGNTVKNAQNGIVGMSVGGSSSPHYNVDVFPEDGDQGPKSLCLNVHDNDVTMTQGYTGVRNTGTGSDTVYTCQRFANNRYHTSLTTPFAWRASNYGWTGWKALGMDSTGTFGP